VEACAARELMEETGLKSQSLRLGPWVENFLDGGQKHYVTIFVFIDLFEGEPTLLEPDRCHGWEWFQKNSLPEPLFAPIPSFIAKDQGGAFNTAFQLKHIKL
jgi:8-oxo-dGTP diphosphatase